MDDTSYDVIPLQYNFSTELKSLSSAQLASIDLRHFVFDDICSHEQRTLELKQARREWLRRSALALETSSSHLKEWVPPEHHHLLSLDFPVPVDLSSLTRLTSAQLIAMKFHAQAKDILAKFSDDILDELLDRRRRAKLRPSASHPSTEMNLSVTQQLPEQTQASPEKLPPRPTEGLAVHQSPETDVISLDDEAVNQSEKARVESEAGPTPSIQKIDAQQKCLTNPTNSVVHTIVGRARSRSRSPRDDNRRRRSRSTPPPAQQRTGNLRASYNGDLRRRRSRTPPLHSRLSRYSPPPQRARSPGRMRSRSPPYRSAYSAQIRAQRAPPPSVYGYDYHGRRA